MLIVALLALLVIADTTNRLGVMLLRDDLFAGDAAQHTWWMYRYADAALFPDDLAARYMSMYVYSPPAYQALFRLLAPHVDAQHLAELIALVLNVTGVALAALLGRRMGGFAGGAAAVLVWVLSQSALLVEGGFPRSFGVPLLLAGMIAIVARRWITFGVVMVVTTLLYPPIVLNLAPVAGVVLLIGLLQHRRPPRRFVGLCACGVIAFAIVALLYIRPLPAEAGPFVTYAQARQMPEWGRDGRTAFFRPWHVFYFHSATAGIGLTLLQTAVALAALLATLLWRRRAIPLEAWLLIGSALTIWALAHALAFKLYLPSRYMTYAVPTFAMMWAAGVATLLRKPSPIPLASEEVRCGLKREASAPASQLGGRDPHPASLCGGGAGIGRWCAMGLLVAVTTVLIIRSTTQAVAAYHGPATWDLPAGFDQAMAFLRSLPVDTKIAAHPYDARAIPLLAHRSVLVNHEVAIPFNVAYYAEMKRRIEATFDMLYATDWPSLDAIAEREGVRVFLLDRHRLSEPSSPDNQYKEPFGAQNIAKIERGEISGFALLNPPPERILFTAGDVMLIDVGRGVQK